MKTKYPAQIDTPSEIPIVRDNVFEIGSDAINSLRSAIIQIEKTLGVNPQGAVGLTVGERISQTLDPSGNLRPEAIDAAGFIHGPIYDDQVASVAAIKESKLKLNFPTQILQSQISVVSAMINEIQNQIESISATLSSHVNSLATNRHPATAISTTEIANTTSATGIRSISASSVQEVLDDIFASHINYDGSSISETNSSHSANQIYFDKTTVSNISSDDVQGAIEDVSGLVGSGVTEHQNLLHSNGFARYSVISDSNNSSYGTLISDSSTASISQNLGDKPYFEVTLDVAIPIPVEPIGVGDIIELSVSGVTSEYQIYQVQYDSGPTNITGFFLFGTFPTTESVIDVKIFLKRFRSSGTFGIISSNREKTGLSSSNNIQISNPDAPYILSSGFNAAEITTSNRYFDVKINGTQHSFDIYDSGITKQSIDSVVRKINDTVDLLGLPILAYRTNLEFGGTELVLAHNISSIDDAASSLEIIRVDGAIDSVGLSEFESKVIYGQPGSAYYIGGNKYTGLLKKLDSTSISIIAGDNTISSGSSAIDFIASGIRIGDVITIIDTTINSYEIESVSTSSLVISTRQLPTGFSTSSTADCRLIIYESNILTDSLEFLNVDSSIASSLLEVFLDSSQKLNFNLILEQESAALVSESLYSVIGISNTLSTATATIHFENTTDNCVNIWLDTNSVKKKIVGDFSYVDLTSDLKCFSCQIFIKDKSALFSYIGIAGDTKSASIFPTQSISKENNFVISTTCYSNFLGKFDGGVNGALFLSKMNFGTLDDKDISTSLRHSLSELPTSELRSSGVVFGLEVTFAENVDGIYKVTVTDGTCYVVGKRFEIIGSAILTGIDTTTYDKLFVGIGRHGNIVFSAPDPSCSYPWAEEEIVFLGTVENDGSSITVIDQRLLIDHLDLKLINSITVSPHHGMGHFIDLVKAIKYAKRFSQIYPLAGTPEIKLKAGTHTVSLYDTTALNLSDWMLDLDVPSSTSRLTYFNNLIRSGLFIDFPLSIVGEGSSSVLDATYNVTASDQTIDLTCGILVAGAGFNTSATSASVGHSTFTSGRVSFGNFHIKEGWISIADLIISDEARVELNGLTFENLTVSTVDKAVFSVGADSFSGVVVFELDDTSSVKGNISISGCSFGAAGNVRLYPDTTPSRYQCISIINCFTGSSSGISTPAIVDTARFPSSNKSYSIGNITSLDTPSDRISSNLTVGGALTVDGLTIINDSVIITGTTAIGGDVFVGTRTHEKTYWLYNSQLPDAVTTPSSVFSASDMFGDSVTSAYRINTVWSGTNLASGDQIFIPSVNIEAGSYCSIPIDIASGQKMKSIRLLGGGTPSDTVIFSIVAFSNNTDIPSVISTSATITRNATQSYFDLAQVYSPSSSLYHVLMIQNTSAITVNCTRIIVTFESANLYEILGVN